MQSNSPTTLQSYSPTIGWQRPRYIVPLCAMHQLMICVLEVCQSGDALRESRSELIRPEIEYPALHR